MLHVSCLDAKIEVCVLIAIAESSMVITGSEGETGELCLVPQSAKRTDTSPSMKIILKTRDEIRPFDPVLTSDDFGFWMAYLFKLF